MTKINPFTRHPDMVRMSYSQHMWFALMLSAKTFGCALTSLIHAFFPFLFVNHTSKTVYDLHALFEKREEEIKKRKETEQDLSGVICLALKFPLKERKLQNKKGT